MASLQVEVLEAGPAAAGDEELLDTVAGLTLTLDMNVLPNRAWPKAPAAGLRIWHQLAARRSHSRACHDAGLV